jgi:hypothetical protein
MADSLVIRGADLLDVDAGEVLSGRQLLIADGAIEPSWPRPNRPPATLASSTSPASPSCPA